MSPGWNLFNSQDSRIASQAGISTGRQRAEPPPLDYSHAATGSPVLGVNLPKTAGQKHKKYPRFQVEIGGVSFHLFPQVAGGFAFLPYAATLCGTQRMEIRCFKKPFGYSHSIKKKCSIFTIPPSFYPWFPLVISRIRFTLLRENSSQTQSFSFRHFVSFAPEF